MARIIKVNKQGDTYRSQKCPQCLRIVPMENVLSDGLKCPRCGKFPWKVVREKHHARSMTFILNPDLRRTKEG